MSREKLRKRFEWFNDGRWEKLIRESQAIADEANTMLRRRTRRQPDESERRAARAHSMVQMGRALQRESRVGVGRIGTRNE